MLQVEQQLRDQLALYTKKFEEFQGTLTKSNEVFEQFKIDMDKMTQTIQKLEGDSGMWKSKWEETNLELFDMVDQRTKKLTEINDLSVKIEKLERIHGALQIDKHTLQ